MIRIAGVRRQLHHIAYPSEAAVQVVENRLTERLPVLNLNADSARKDWMMHRIS
jgi:hypothetical protein